VSRASAAAISTTPTPAAYAVDPAASEIRYQIVHKLHRVTGSSRAVQGKVLVRDDGSFLGGVLAPVASFRSGDDDRDARAREILERGGHRLVVFKGSARLPPGGAAQVVPVEGELTLHGARRPLTVLATVEADRAGALRVRGSFEVSLDAYGVERPSLLLIRIDDACRIDIDLTLRPV
jgi:polyisoprenoid-binding protein YceI